MKGDVSGVECFCYFRGRDGMGQCTTECQWWPKENGISVKEYVCPQWISPELWDTQKDFPKDEKGMFCITVKEYEERYNTKVVIEEVEA